MSYLKISEKLANYITQDLDYSEEQKEIITYSIETIILQIGGFLLIVFLAYFFNAIKPAVIAAIFGAVLRKLSGGAHFNSAVMCLSFGAVVYTLIGMAAKYIYLPSNLIYVLFLFCFMLIVSLAPVDSPAKPIHSQAFKKKLKLGSTVFLIFAFIMVLIIDSAIFKTSATLGMVYQSLTLLPILNRH